MWYVNDTPMICQAINDISIVVYSEQTQKYSDNLVCQKTLTKGFILSGFVRHQTKLIQTCLEGCMKHAISNISGYSKPLSETLGISVTFHTFLPRIQENRARTLGFHGFFNTNDFAKS